MTEDQSLELSHMMADYEAMLDDLYLDRMMEVIEDIHETIDYEN